MFSLIRKGFRFLTNDYVLKVNIPTLDADGSGNWTVVTLQTKSLSANIQNKEDGASIKVGRSGSLVYKTIIILTKDRIGLGDPVYPDIENEEEIQYIVGAYGEEYRIMLEGGVQKDDSTVNMSGHVFYRYYADLLRN